MPAIELFNTILFTDPNLQAYYRLESGALTTDSGINGITLTNNGTVTSIAGLFGNGASITSNAQYLSVANNLGITGGAITLMGWIKVNTEPTTQQYNLMFQSTTGGPAYWIDYEYNGGTKRLNFARYNGSTQYTFYTVTLGTSSYHHLALTNDGVNTTGYLDGVQVVAPTSATGAGNAGTGSLFNIAKDQVNGDQNANHGIYDDCAIFNRALSGTEISQYFNGTLPLSRIQNGYSFFM